MARRCSTALVLPPGGGHGGDGVEEASAGEEILGFPVSLYGPGQDTARLPGGLGLFRVHGGDGVVADGGEAQGLEGHGHGVGRVLAAAGPGAGDGVPFDGGKLLVSDPPGGPLSHGLEHGNDGELPPLPLPGGDGTPVEDHAWNPTPDHPHGPAGYGLVAGGEDHHPVVEVALGHQFHAVGDHLPAYEARPHPGGAHADAIGDGRGPELKGEDPGLPKPGLHVQGQLAEVVVAGHAVGEGIHHPHEGPSEVLVPHAHRPEHGAGGGLLQSLFDAVGSHASLQDAVFP